MVSIVAAKAYVRHQSYFIVLFYELEALFFTANLLYPVHSLGGFSEVLS